MRIVSISGILGGNYVVDLGWGTVLVTRDAKIWVRKRGENWTIYLVPRGDRLNAFAVDVGSSASDATEKAHEILRMARV